MRVRKLPDAIYKDYIKEHKANVIAAYNEMQQSGLLHKLFLKHGVTDEEKLELSINIRNHDDSKYSEEEFMPYALHFYGGPEFQTVEWNAKYDAAWEHHKAHNPHHWEYFTDRDEEMPLIYIIEMLCDWWSFSFKTNNLSEILTWYDRNKDTIMLLPDTQSIVTDSLVYLEKYIYVK